MSDSSGTLIYTRSSLCTSIEPNEDGTLSTTANIRTKRDSNTSHITQSSSQNAHSKKGIASEIRVDPTLAATTTAAGTTATTRTALTRYQPIIRAAQIRADADQTVFKIHKGAKTFDLCPVRNILATGGMDRVVRVWNPYLPARPIARLRGHNAPVYLVKITAEDNRLFSVSADKTVLVSLHDRSHFLSAEEGSTRERITTVVYSMVDQSFFRLTGET